MNEPEKNTDAGSVALNAGLDALPENAEERKLFNASLKIYADPLEAIQDALRLWGKMNPHGSFGAQCIIFANEIGKVRRASN